MKIDLREQPIPIVQNYLQHAIAPRPICFASTINKKGEVNLSPFSFFNLFSSNPPIVIFSPARRIRNNSIKHTLENILEVPEVVINIVDYDMVQQVSLASCEFAAGVNEFVKAGFTPEDSSIVKPPRVRESKINLECRVIEVKHLGDKGGAGNLIFAEVLVMHIDDNILNEKQMIDQTKINHVARLGGNWYCRIDKSNLFEVEKPNVLLGIGIDALPQSVRNSKILTGNHLGQLGNVHEMPTADPAFYNSNLKQIYQYFSVNPEEMDHEIHRYAAQLLDEGEVSSAWQVLLASE